MTPSPWPHFTVEELACPCCGAMEMDSIFMAKLGLFRLLLGFKLPVTSGYRCPDYNEKISTTGRDGPHTTGKAVDISISGPKVSILIPEAFAFGFMGIGPHQAGDYSGRYVHLDLCNRSHQTFWTYG